MSALIPFGQKSGVPSAFADIFKGVATLERNQVERFPLLSFKGGKFACVINGETHVIRDERGIPVSSLDVIVVGIPKGRANVYFPTYDPDKAQAPICSAINGRTPDLDVKTPQSANCATCERKIKVMDEKGKERAPCQPKMYLAVVVRGQEDKIYKFALSITGIYHKESENQQFKAWDQYTDWLRKNGVMHPAQVVTTICFSDDQFPRPMFNAAGHLTDEMLQAIAPAIQSTVTKEICEGTVEQIGDGQQPVRALAQVETKALEAPKDDAAAIEAKVRAELEAKAKAEAAAKVRTELEAKAKAEAAAQVNKAPTAEELAAEAAAKMEAEIRARIMAEMAGKAEVKPVKEEKPKKSKPVVIAEPNADLDAALDW
jgi:hypothetical protein